MVTLSDLFDSFFFFFNSLGDLMSLFLSSAPSKMLSFQVLTLNQNEPEDMRGNFLSFKKRK